MKRITVLLTIMTLLLCTACSDSVTSASESSNEAQQTELIGKTVQAEWEDNQVYEWRDYYITDTPFGPDFELKLELAEFPDTVFIWRDTAIYAYANDELCPLVYGMPLWNAFFTDLNDDGFPELCTTVSFGSGIIDERIVVYDYHNKQEYVLADRTVSDYSLYSENDTLYVRELPYARGEHAEANTGQLAIENGELVMKQQHIETEKDASEKEA